MATERETLQPAQRPWEVTLLVVLGYIGGFFNLLGGVLIMLDRQDDTFQGLTFHSENQLLAFGLMVAVIGIAQIFLANLLGKGSQIVRVFYAVIAVFNLAAGVWAMVALQSEQRASGTVAAVVSLIVLWLLFNRKSEDFFETA
ncbi:MAG: hypothetical protein GY812_04775 [Actinomycetia bacterium]|nr:hypothetical protein [Actinomycetes bacterium]